MDFQVEDLKVGDSLYFPNPASSREGEIIIYDSAFDSSRNLARILAHELAHETFRRFSKDDQEAYQAATNWFIFTDPRGKRVSITRKDGFVEPDGDSSPEEDFANNIEYFIFNPTKLEKVTPLAYNGLKKRFGDSLKAGKGRTREK